LQNLLRSLRGTRLQRAPCKGVMSAEEYSNQITVVATDIHSSLTGELMRHDRLSIRGKGDREKKILTFVAIFTFNNPVFCEESEVPENGGYFLNEKGKAELTQLIGRFDTQSERDEWVSNTFDLSAKSDS